MAKQNLERWDWFGSVIDPFPLSPKNLESIQRLAKQPELRISFDCLACARDRKLSRSEGISDEAGEDVDHGVHDRPVA